MINKNNIEKEIIRKAFKYYRKNFPFVKLTEHELLIDFKKVLFSEPKITKRYNYKGEIYHSVGSNSCGIKFCQHFMPHQQEVRVSGTSGSPMDAFNKKKLLKKCIRMCFKYRGDVKQPGVLNYLSRVEWHQFATNFRPVAGKAIYEKYLKNNSITYDFSSGFGGRLVGFLSNKYSSTSKYIGVDPSSKTIEGLNKIIKFCNASKNAEVYKTCAEDFCPKELIGKVDFAFSSPPYFRKELYSEEETQSYKKYPEYEMWRKYFLAKTILNCHTLLKPGGIFAINIANIKLNNKSINCADDTKKICSKTFGDMKELLILPMNTMLGFEDSPKKMEPIYVFQKKH